jgi:hypothetical protein
MSMPVSVEAVIARRLLVNFRIAPEVLAALLPPIFEPRLIGNWGMAGICLIGLRNLRPQGVPSLLGLSTENAAHRIAVEWNSKEGRRQGVYIPRRDSNSLITRTVGGRLFPGIHHRGVFSVTEAKGQVTVAMRSADGSADVFVSGRLSDRLTGDSIFGSLDAASHFFEVGSLGFSPTAQPNRYEGLELATNAWRVEALEVEEVRSSFFGEARFFPPGSVQFDSALLMRDVPCRWRSRGTLVASPSIELAAS